VLVLPKTRATFLANSRVSCAESLPIDTCLIVTGNNLDVNGTGPPINGGRHQARRVPPCGCDFANRHPASRGIARGKRDSPFGQDCTVRLARAHRTLLRCGGGSALAVAMGMGDITRPSGRARGTSPSRCVAVFQQGFAGTDVSPVHRSPCALPGFGTQRADSATGPPERCSFPSLGRSGEPWQCALPRDGAAQRSRPPGPASKPPSAEQHAAGHQIRHRRYAEQDDPRNVIGCPGAAEQTCRRGPPETSIPAAVRHICLTARFRECQ